MNGKTKPVQIQNSNVLEVGWIPSSKDIKPLSYTNTCVKSSLSKFVTRNRIQPSIWLCFFYFSEKRKLARIGENGAIGVFSGASAARPMRRLQINQTQIGKQLGVVRNPLILQ